MDSEDRDDRMRRTSGPDGRMGRTSGPDDEIRVLRRRVEQLEAAFARQAAELQHEHRLLEAVVESMGEGLNAVDEDGRFILFNRKAREMIGEGPLSVPPEQWSRAYGVFEAGGTTLFPAERLPLYRALNGETVTDERLTVELGGGVRHLSLTATPLVASDGRRGGGVAVFRDITDEVQREEHRRRLEEKLMQAQKYESLAVLAGGIAHDFNNLLMGILTNADVALSDMSPTAPGRECVEDIVLSASRAAELCRQMLAYSGKGKFVVTTFNLANLVKDMAHLLQASIAKNVVLRFNFANRIPPIDGDATQIRQVVMNLITNASDAIGDDPGVILISTGTLHASAQYLASLSAQEDLPPGHYNFVEISDDGVGMNDDTQARMFDPFFTTKRTGRGLGLAATLGIIRGHGGAVKVYSQPGQGTTVKVLLPVSEHTGALAYADQEPPAIWRGGGLVLVIDDEGVVRTAAARVLTRHGFEFITARDGRDGVALFEEHRRDLRLVLLDMSLPGISGEEVYRRLRLIDERVPVLLSSGYNEQEVKGRFIGKGLAGFIQKPYTQDQLMSAIRAVLEA